MDNKFPGKDISNEDLKTKFPLCAKKHKNHKSSFEVSGVKFGGKCVSMGTTSAAYTRVLDVREQLLRSLFGVTNSLGRCKLLLIYSCGASELRCWEQNQKTAVLCEMTHLHCFFSFFG